MDSYTLQKNLFEAVLVAETKRQINQRPVNRSEVTRKSRHPAAKRSEKCTNRRAELGTHPHAGRNGKARSAGA